MSRLVAGIIPIAVTALLASAALFAPSLTHPDSAGDPVSGRTSLTCPSFTSTTVTSQTAIAPGDDLAVTGVAQSTPDVVAGAVSIVENKVATRVSGVADEPFGGTTVATATAGPYRGVTLASCLAPVTESWLTGVESNDGVLTDLVLTNIDNAEAAVDLTFYGADGEVAAAGARGIVVDASSERAISLKPLVSQDGPITIHVETSNGRVAAFARETMWDGSTPVGTDLITPAESGEQLIVPGVPGGSGTRELVVGNPSERNITVDVSALTANGPVALSGADQMDVPPRSTRTVALEAGLDEQPAAISLTADTSVTAAVRSITTDESATSDIAVSSASNALPNRVVTPLTTPTNATATVIVSGDIGEESAGVVSFTDASGKALGDDQPIELAAGASTPIEVPDASELAISIETTSGSLWATVVVTATLGKVQGIGIAATSGRSDSAIPTVVEDPHVGR